MSYLTRLETNNTNLQACIDKANALPEAGGEAVTPVISVNNTNGLITATAGTKSSTYQLAFQSAKTITPGTTNQTAVSSGYYTGGVVTVKGDVNLVPANIVNGKSIFGVQGTAVTGTDTTAEDNLVTRALTTYSNGRVTKLGTYVFAYCSSLTTVNFPNVTSIGASAFEYCRSLGSVAFPVASEIDLDAFSGCVALTNTNFPKVTSLNSRAFTGCTQLKTIRLPSLTFIGSSVFRNCTNLSTIYLLNPSRVCTLRESKAFSGTGIGSTKGTIYVPASLLASYKTATNWTYFSSRMVGI